MLMEFLSHLLALDVAWIISLILNNLFFLFAFVAVMHFFTEGKRVLAGFIVLTVTAWVWGDFFSVVGLMVFTGSFLMVNYLGKLTVLAFAENSRALKKHLLMLNELQGIGTLIVYGILMYIGVGF